MGGTCSSGITANTWLVPSVRMQASHIDERGASRVGGTRQKVETRRKPCGPFRAKSTQSNLKEGGGSWESELDGRPPKNASTMGEQKTYGKG